MNRWRLRCWFVAFPLAVLLLAATPTVAAGPGEATDGKRVALVVGNGAYRNTVALPNPPNDARAMAQALRSVGFQVLEGVDLDRRAFERIVRDFAAEVEGARAALFFYAGHGLEVAGRNYMLPVDAELSRPTDLPFETVDLDIVLGALETGPRTSLVFLDACRDNPLARSLARAGGRSRSASVGRGLAQIDAPAGMLVAFATRPGTTAADGSGENSPFTESLLSHLTTPGLEVRQVMTRVRQEVLQATGNLQQPWDESSLVEDFYFVPPAEAPVAVAANTAPRGAEPASVPRALDGAYEGRDQVAFEAIRDSRRDRDFALFVERYPESALAPFAKDRLEELRSSTTAALPPRPATPAPGPEPAVPAAPAPVVAAPPPPSAVPHVGLGGWEQVFGGRRHDTARSLAATLDHGLTLVGDTASKGAGKTDGWILRVDSGGRLLWEQTFGGPGQDSAGAVVGLPDGGLAVAGYVQSELAGADALVRRVDAGGRVLWERAFGGAAWDVAEAVALMPDGNLAVAGSTRSKGNGGADAWVLRLDPDGDLVWEATFGGKLGDTARALLATPDGGLVVGGSTESRGAGGSDAWVFKLDAGGRLAWERTFGGPAWDLIGGLARTQDGGLAVAGTTRSRGAGGSDGWVLRLDGEGGLVWERTFGGPAQDEAAAVAALPGGALAVAGTTESTGAGGSDAWVLGLDAGGGLVWERTFGGPAQDGAAAVAALPGSGLAVAGTIRSKGAGEADFWVFSLGEGGASTPDATASAGMR